MHIVNSALRLISIGCAILGAGAVGVTAIVYVMEVVFRYGFNNPLNWAGDIGSYMLCASVFLAVPLITRRRGHIAVTVVLDTLPEELRARIVRILELVTAILLLIVTLFVIDLCIRQYHQNVLTTLANQIPRWWLTAVMALGLLLSALNFIAPADGAPEEAREF